MAMEKAFEVMECSDEEKVTYGTYMLQSSAFEWWDAHKKYILRALQLHENYLGNLLYSYGLVRG